MDELDLYEKINMISNFIYRYFDRINLKSKTYDFEVDSDDSSDDEPIVESDYYSE